MKHLVKAAKLAVVERRLSERRFLEKAFKAGCMNGTIGKVCFQELIVELVKKQKLYALRESLLFVCVHRQYQYGSYHQSHRKELHFTTAWSKETIVRHAIEINGKWSDARCASKLKCSFGTFVWARAEIQKFRENFQEAETLHSFLLRFFMAGVDHIVRKPSTLPLAKDAEHAKKI